MKKIWCLFLVFGLITSCAQKPTALKSEALVLPQTYAVKMAQSESRFWGSSYGYVITDYAPSERNVAVLKSLQSEGTALGRVAVAPFNKTFTCRKRYQIAAGGSQPSFARLFQHAVNTELEQSGLVVSRRQRTRMTIDEFDFITVGKNKWVFRATLKGKGKQPLTIEHEQRIPFALTSESICKNAVEVLNPAIQNFLHALYTHPRFAEFVRYPLYRKSAESNAVRFITRKRNN